MRIVKRSALILKVPIHEDGAYEIARRSRGTPRVANRLLKRVRDYAQVRAKGVITSPSPSKPWPSKASTSQGLSELDRKLLKVIIFNYKGGPAGIEALAATLQLESDVLLEVVEPYLLKTGLVIRTSQGRKASEKAYEHLGLPHHGKAHGASGLFEDKK